MIPDPGKRRTSLILIGAAALLLISIWIGKSMGDRVIRKATEEGQTGVATAVAVAASPGASGDATPFGPNWKRTQVLAAAPDPGFPDPRVPPEPLPTVPPTPKPTPRPKDTPTPAPTAPGTATPYPKATSPYLLHGPTVTPVPIKVNPKDAPTPEASPVLGPSNPPPQ
jgi:hypothetical protein